MAAACSRRRSKSRRRNLAQVTDRTPVSRLLGISWVAVGNIVERVVARRLDGAPDQGMGARLSAARWGQVSESARSARPGLPCGRSPAAGVRGSARCPRRIIAVWRRPNEEQPRDHRVEAAPASPAAGRRARRPRPGPRLGGRGLRRRGEGAHVAPSAPFPDWGQSVRTAPPPRSAWVSNSPDRSAWGQSPTSRG